MQLQSSNPVLNSSAFEPYSLYGEQAAPTTASVQGVIGKTAILISIALVTGGVGYSLVATTPGVLFASWAAAFITSLIMYFWLHRKPEASVFGAPIYAAVEGLFLGAFTGVVDWALAQRGIAILGGIGLQAFVITLCSVLAMLGLYSTGVVRKTPGLVRFITIMSVATALTYLVSIGLWFFGINMPLVSMWSAFDGGAMAWLGLGFNVVVLGIAALTLVLDFDLIEQHVAQGAPKRLEWYCGFALLVTLAWIYWEAVRLMFRLAIILNDRR